eukprot:UN23826
MRNFLIKQFEFQWLIFSEEKFKAICGTLDYAPPKNSKAAQNNPFADVAMYYDDQQSTRSSVLSKTRKLKRRKLNETVKDRFGSAANEENSNASKFDRRGPNFTPSDYLSVKSAQSTPTGKLEEMITPGAAMEDPAQVFKNSRKKKKLESIDDSLYRENLNSLQNELRKDGMGLYLIENQNGVMLNTYPTGDSKDFGNPGLQYNNIANNLSDNISGMPNDNPNHNQYVNSESNQYVNNEPIPQEPLLQPVLEPQLQAQIPIQQSQPLPVHQLQEPIIANANNSSVIHPGSRMSNIQPMKRINTNNVHINMNNSHASSVKSLNHLNKLNNEPTMIAGSQIRSQQSHNPNTYAYQPYGKINTREIIPREMAVDPAGNSVQISKDEYYKFQSLELRNSELQQKVMELETKLQKAVNSKKEVKIKMKTLRKENKRLQQELADKQANNSFPVSAYEQPQSHVSQQSQSYQNQSMFTNQMNPTGNTIDTVFSNNQVRGDSTSPYITNLHNVMAKIIRIQILTQPIIKTQILIMAYISLTIRQ